MDILIRISISALLLLACASLIDGIKVKKAVPALIGALILGVLNAALLPVLQLVALPFTIVTLGLFSWVLNAMMIKLAAALTPGFEVKGIWPAMLASLVLALSQMALRFVGLETWL